VVWQRLPTIAGAYSQELVTQRHWGGLWLAVALGLLCVPRAERTRWMALLGTPLIAGAAVFALSAWGDVGEHLAVTVPRQLILLAPLLTATSLSWINKNILSRS
jgi:hypothetical protein